MKILLTILFFTSFVNLNFGQWTVSGGFPRTQPNNNQFAKNHLDSLTGRSFYFKSPKWFARGVVVSATMPTDTSYFVQNIGLITVSYQNLNCRWYNTTSSSYWNWTGTAWQNETALNLANILDSVNIWTKKNTFKDSLIAEKGIKSGGVVDSKGLNTEGGVEKPAAKISGVTEVPRRIITENSSLNGLDGYLEIFCSTANISIDLPSVANTRGWIYNVKRRDATPYVVRFIRPDGSEINILNACSVVLRNNGTNWNFD